MITLMELSINVKLKRNFFFENQKSHFLLLFLGAMKRGWGTSGTFKAFYLTYCLVPILKEAKQLLMAAE